MHEIAEADVVVHHLLAHGTQQGPLGPAPASGKAASWREVHVMRFADGVMVEQWGVVDRLAILQQLGIAPTPPGR